MTERETEERLRQALLEALREDWAETPAEETPPSPRQQRRMRAMLADPNGDYRRRSRPLWQRAARTAASILLVCTMGLGLMMAASPDIRAGVLRWVREVRPDSVFYRFSGEDREAQGLRYTITKLPDGYGKTDERTEEPGFFQVTYRNGAGQEIVLSCADPARGPALAPDTEGLAAAEVALPSGTGRLYPAAGAEGASVLVWLDEGEGVQYRIEAPVDGETLADMAVWVWPEMPRYVLEEVPEGYAQTLPLQESIDSASLLYTDEEGWVFSVQWMYMRQGIGVSFSFGTGEGVQSKEVTIRGLPGTYYWAEGDDFPGVVWMDEAQNLMFAMSGRFSEEELLRLAEGLVPAE